MRRRNLLRLIVKLCVFFTCLLTFCEYIIYFVQISLCKWPTLDDTSTLHHEKNLQIKAMFLADTHLLGSHKGHWFDKLRREWQMYRAFQSAITLLDPEVVFVLGDLFDEGHYCKEEEFQYYINRFASLFQVPEHIKLYVVPGNHDMGFHYRVHPYLLNRFNRAFNITAVERLTIKDSHFLLINSMAMEGDGCYLCRPAMMELSKLAKDFDCARGFAACPALPMHYSRPIILQHFPMYRESDSVCNESDEAPADIKNEIFRQKWDCLSKDASEMIYNKFNPRLIITGHTHHGCHVMHRDDIHEFTVPSFSWRNKNNPTFLMGVISPNSFEYRKCHIPQETTVIALYIISTILCVAYWFSRGFRRKKFSKGKYTNCQMPSPYCSDAIQHLSVRELIRSAGPNG